MASLDKYFLTSQVVRLFPWGEYSDSGPRDQLQDFIVKHGIRFSYDEYREHGTDYESFIRVGVEKIHDEYEQLKTLGQYVDHPSLIRQGSNAVSLRVNDIEYYRLTTANYKELKKVWPYWSDIFQEVLSSAWENWKKGPIYNGDQGGEGWILEARYPYSHEISGWLNLKELTRARNFLNKQESIGKMHGKMYSFHRFVENVLSGWLTRTSLPTEQMLAEAYLFRYKGRSKKTKSQQFKDNNINIAPGEYVLVSARKADKWSSRRYVKLFDSIKASDDEKERIFDQVDKNRQVEDRLKYRYCVHFIDIDEDRSVASTRVHINDLDSIIMRIPKDTRTRTKIHTILTSKNGKLKSEPIELNQTEASFLYFLMKEREAEEAGWLSNPEKHKKVLEDIDNLLELPSYFSDEISKRPSNPKTWIWGFHSANRRSIKRCILKESRRVIEGDPIISIEVIDQARPANYSLTSSIKHIKIEVI